jgi:hypothetical protein
MMWKGTAHEWPEPATIVVGLYHNYLDDPNHPLTILREVVLCGYGYYNEDGLIEYDRNSSGDILWYKESFESAGGGNRPPDYWMPFTPPEY